MIKNIKEAESFLKTLYPKAAELTGKNVTVDRMWPLLELVGNPQNYLKVVHIAGTSGKTSTAYFCSALLSESGKKVGLTVSPHITKITERLQINGTPIDDVLFCDLLNEFINITGDQSDASYFEFMIVFILWSFCRLEVDYAVIETGLGGLHDSTNVCRRSDKVCVITDIGYDHQNILGNTIDLISAQKAGIIHKDNEVFMYKQSTEVNKIFEEHVKIIGAKLVYVKSVLTKYDNFPKYQQRNWQLAYSVYKFLAKRDGLRVLSEDNIMATKVQVPGRMQEIKIKKQTIVLDGAHNPQKMSAFVDSFKKMYSESLPVPVLLAMKKDKDYKKTLKILISIAKSIHCFEFKSSQDMPISSVASIDLVLACKKLGFKNAYKYNSIEDAILYLKSHNEPIVIVTGSLYTLGDAMRVYQSRLG